jgi:hypothetical protein
MSEATLSLGLHGLNSSGTTRVYIGIHFELHPFLQFGSRADLDISWLLPFRRTLDLILIVVTLSLNDGTSCWLDFDLRPMEPTLHLS